ncbi:hypothetical protein K9L97_03865 [Candidatus Woesearchaeota archaeon]|nr:hypothetical protein [Candidatus Woesearchaeota archaeon]
MKEKILTITLLIVILILTGCTTQYLEMQNMQIENTNQAENKGRTTQNTQTDEQNQDIAIQNANGQTLAPDHKTQTNPTTQQTEQFTEEKTIHYDNFETGESKTITKMIREQNTKSQNQEPQTQNINNQNTEQSNEIKILTIIINFQDNQNATEEHRQNFEDAFTNYKKSVQKYYEEVSNGEITINPEIIGPYTVPYGWENTECITDQNNNENTQNQELQEYEKWINSAINKAEEDNYDTEEYDKIAVAWPHTNSCFFSGITYLQGNKALIGINNVAYSKDYNSKVLIHEIGHYKERKLIDHPLVYKKTTGCYTQEQNQIKIETENCSYTDTGATDGDPFDVMGATLDARHFNPDTKQKWLILQETKTILLNQMIENNENTITENIYLESSQQTPNILILKNEETGEKYALEIREPKGLFDDFKEEDRVVNGVSIRNTEYEKSILIDATPQTETYKDSAFIQGQELIINKYIKLTFENQLEQNQRYKVKIDIIKKPIGEECANGKQCITNLCAQGICKETCNNKERCSNTNKDWENDGICTKDQNQKNICDKNTLAIQTETSTYHDSCQINNQEINQEIMCYAQDLSKNLNEAKKGLCIKNTCIKNMNIIIESEQLQDTEDEDTKIIPYALPFTIKWYLKENLQNCKITLKEKLYDENNQLHQIIPLQENTGIITLTTRTEKGYKEKIPMDIECTEPENTKLHLQIKTTLEGKYDCQDSDNNDNPYKKGIITGIYLLDGTKPIDACQDNQKLTEYSCKQEQGYKPLPIKQAYYKTITCENECINGACTIQQEQ